VTTTGAAGNSEVSKLGQRGGEERSLDDDIPLSESMEVELDSVYSGGNSSGPMDSESGPPTRDRYINNPMLAGGEKEGKPFCGNGDTATPSSSPKEAAVAAAATQLSLSEMAERLATELGLTREEGESTADLILKAARELNVDTEGKKTKAIATACLVEI
jgi:hypothetical protein